MGKQRRRRYSESANQARAGNDRSESSAAASQTRPSATSTDGEQPQEPATADVASPPTAAEPAPASPRETGPQPPQPLALEDMPLRPSSDGMPAVTLNRKQCPTCRERYPADFRVCPRDATELEEATDTASDPLLGAVLGDAYQVLRVIGEGAMGRVYEARHTRLYSKRFAIKVLHGDLTRQPEVVGRFLREAEATSALHHPNIVGVLDVNRVPDGRPYIVAELLEGDQLGDYLERHGKLPWREAIAICRPICRALVAAHDKDIVHRDIKPENVFLVTEAGERTTKVLDFGISRVGDAAASITKTGMVMGTPSYMPPEQARGARVDHRADIYAVGAILYEAVTGKRPFDDNDPIATLAAVLTKDPPRPCSFDPSLPPALELVIQKAMAKEPAERYQSMRELDQALATFDVEEPPPSAAEDSSERKSAPQLGVRSNLGFWGSHGAPEQARANLSALSIAAGVCALLCTIDVSTSLVRWSRDGAPLTAAEIVLATLGSIGLLATPFLAWTRYLLTRVWPSTPRVLDVEARTKRVLAASLVTYGVGSLLVHVFAGAFRARSTGLVWAGWSVLVFLAAAAVGGVVAWSAFKTHKND